MISSIHIIGSKGFGGAENFYCRLVQALHEQGHPVIAINPPGSDVAMRLGTGVRQIHVKMGSVLDVFSRWSIGRHVARIRPAIVQTYMGRATRLTHLREGQGIVHIARLGGYYNLKGYRHAHAWVGNTRDICDYMVNHGLSRERVFHIGNFVDEALPVNPDRLRALRELYRIPDHALVLVSISRLHPNKGIDVLLDGFHRLPESIQGRPLHLLVVGDGPLRQALQGQAHPRIHWAGWQDDTAPYYQIADVFVCPSRHEPLGNVILEAWSHRRAVLSTRTQGAEALITDGQDGVLVPTEDPEALAGGLQALAQDDERRERLAQHGQLSVTTHHSRQAIVQQYIEMYTALGKRHGCAA